MKKEDDFKKKIADAPLPKTERPKGEYITIKAQKDGKEEEDAKDPVPKAETIKDYLKEQKEKKIIGELVEKQEHEKGAERSYHSSKSNSQKYTFFDSIMTGLGENYIHAFGAFLKATTFQFSLLVSLPQFIGGFVQLFTFDILNIFRSRKALNIFFSVLQSLIWIPVIWLLFSGVQSAVWVFIILICMYFSISLIINPIWNSWIMDIVSTEERGDYLGSRSVIINLVCLIAFFAGGLFLYFSKAFYGNELWGFALIFIFSIVFNLIAAYFLIKTYEPRYVLVKPKISLGKFVTSIKRDNQGWIVLYLVLMAFAVAVSAPFYTIYLLNSLKMNYMQYAALIVAPILARILFAKKIGAIIDKYGPKKLLKISPFLIVFNPLLWLFFKSFWWLLLAQFYSGIAYGIFEMASITYLFNSTSSEERISLLTFYNFFNGAFMLAGALASNLVVSFGPFADICLNGLLVSGLLRFVVFLIPGVLLFSKQD